MIWPKPDELWVAGPEDLMADGKWLKLKRSTAEALHREIGAWLKNTTPEPEPVPVNMDGRNYREYCFRAVNALDSMDPWESVSAETKKYWNKLAKARGRWIGNE